MRRLSSSSTCILIYPALPGHLRTVQTNPLTHLHKYFSLAVLFKDGFITADEMPLGNELEAG